MTAVDPPAFILSPHSVKVECTVCHRKGYAGGRWMEACRRGHAQCSRGCGKWMSVLANGNPRTHARCPVPHKAAS